MNIVLLIGRLTKPPEIKYFSGGDQSAMATFTLAVDRQGRDGEKQADFPRIVVYGKQAENCQKYLDKGRKVAVQGKLRTGSYKNKDGVTVYTTDVVADRVEFLDKGQSEQAPAQQPNTYQQPEQVPMFEAIDEQVPF